MPFRILSQLQDYLSRGPITLGQVRVRPGYILHHVDDDPDATNLETFHEVSAARRLVLYDEAGQYRPLKSAPNLRRGWRLLLPTITDVRLALDTFYPAALGLWVAFQENLLNPVPWRETINRQTGMYRIVGLITDEQSEALFQATCHQEGGCLRRVLWPLEPNRPHGLTEKEPEKLRELPAAGEIPLLCSEACNLLVAAGRPIVKAARATAQAAENSAQAASSEASSQAVPVKDSAEAVAPSEQSAAP